MQTPKHLQNQQQGFVLALALLLMLFIGVIVISSAQRTGTETRVAQSEAPIATLQAAAEEGLFQLRRAIEEKAKNSNNLEEFQDEINGINSSSAIDSLLLKAVDSHPKKFADASGFRNVYWWFQPGQDYINAGELTDVDGTETVTITAQVFVGQKQENPGPFMSADIQIIENPDSNGSNGGIDGPSHYTDSDIDQFYDPDFPDSLDEDLYTFAKLPHNSVLDPSTLSEDKLNIIVLEGEVHINMSSDFAGKQLLIVNNTGEDFHFYAGSTGKGSGKAGGQGAGGGGIEGWIIAPNSNMQMGTGIPHLDMDIHVNSCVAHNGNIADCFKPQGGFSFNGFNPDDFVNPPPVPGGPEDTNLGIDVQSFQMNFDY